MTAAKNASTNGGDASRVGFFSSLETRRPPLEVAFDI